MISLLRGRGGRRSLGGEKNPWDRAVDRRKRLSHLVGQALSPANQFFHTLLGSGFRRKASPSLLLHQVAVAFHQAPRDSGHGPLGFHFGAGTLRHGGGTL